MLQIVAILAMILALMKTVFWGRERLPAERFSWGMKAVFALYLLGNAYCTLFSRVPGSGTTLELRPFMSIVRIFVSVEYESVAGDATGLFAWFMSGASQGAGIILNILLYYPLGYLLSGILPSAKARSLILTGFFCSVATELLQYLLAMGWCETDDVICNTLGAALGVWAWSRQFGRKQEPSA